MLFKTRTLSALPLSTNKSKSAFENKILEKFKQRSLDENYMKNSFNSDEETALYFKLLFYGCACMLVWKYIWVLPVILFFLAINVLKRLLDYFGVWLFFENQYNCFVSKLKNWWDDRYVRQEKLFYKDIGFYLNIHTYHHSHCPFKGLGRDSI